MSTTWEYKAVTLKHAGGSFALSQTPTDDETTAALNREGALGWELIHALCANTSQPLTLFFKRPR
jgi:hypothetical protein